MLGGSQDQKSLLFERMFTKKLKHEKRYIFQDFCDRHIVGRSDILFYNGKEPVQGSSRLAYVGRSGRFHNIEIFYLFGF